MLPRAGDPWRRVTYGLVALGAIVIVATAGYMAQGLGFLDALYQTITTVTTVGYREVGHPDGVWKVFTMLVIVLGVGTALFTLGVIVEALVEGRLTDTLGRRRMEREIARMKGHTIVCGWGRVGRAIATQLDGIGMKFVVVDRDPERAATVAGPVVVGDATDDAVLQTAGIERARSLVAALDTDADNLYVTLTGRSLCPDLFIVARARVESAEPKLLQAGADRVVNPQKIGGARMAAMVSQPSVAEFLDVVMHDGNVEFRLEEIKVPRGSELASRTIRETHLRDRTGALVLALREQDGTFVTNPDPEHRIDAGHVLIVIGTSAQLAALDELAGTGG